jgi:hypothetical protein
MQQLDAISELVGTSEYVVSVHGRGEDFVLFPVDDALDVEAAGALLIAKDYYFCGVLCIRNGVPEMRCEPDPESARVMARAAMSFARLAASRITAAEAAETAETAKLGDSAGWLEGLHGLDDPRP